MSVLIYAESAEGKLKKVALELASYAKKVAEMLGTTVTAVTVNANDVSELAKGTYIIMIKNADNGTVANTRFVKE